MSRYALARRQEFQPYCPSGGQWYACEAGSRFVGCCDDDPCSIRGCNQGNLKPASFNPAHHGTFPDLECNSGNWYTCNGTSPPFMGCCKSNACAQGCPTEDLAAGHMGNNEALASQFYTQESPSTSSKSSTRAIVGGAVGGVAGLIILASLLFCYYRHAAKSRKAWSSGVDVRNSQNSEKVGNGATDVSEASGHYQAYKPHVVEADSPSSENKYTSHHARSYSHEMSASSPLISELPSDASPHLSPHSPTQHRPYSHELSAMSPIYTTSDGSPHLGLGLNVPSDQARYSSACSPTTTHRAGAGSASPPPSELSANMSTKR